MKAALEGCKIDGLHCEINYHVGYQPARELVFF